MQCIHRNPTLVTPATVHNISNNANKMSILTIVYNIYQASIPFCSHGVLLRRSEEWSDAIYPFSVSAWSEQRTDVVSRINSSTLAVTDMSGSHSAHGDDVSLWIIIS